MDLRQRAKNILFLLGLVVTLNFSANAQDLQEEYENSEIAEKELNREKWKSISNTLVYTQKEKEEVDLDRPPRFSIPTGALPILKVVSLLLVGGILAFLLYKLFANKSDLNKKVDRTKLSAKLLDNLEDHIHEADFDKLLKEAIETGNYQAACRILYIKSIKTMSDDGLLVWKKEKTNASYLSEIREYYTLYKLFFSLTLSYEEAWYGNKVIDRFKFETIKDAFDKLEGILGTLRKGQEAEANPA